MYFPRMKLTPYEQKRGVVKYYDHNTGKRGVLRKMYGGYLALTQTQRQPVFNFQIARRCRVFALTASGDLAQFRIQIQDSSGESYLANPVSMPSLFGGYVDIPPPAFGNSTAGATGGFPPNVDDAANTLGWAAPQGVPHTENPFVFEPAITLDSNQVLAVTGYSLTDYANVDYRVDLTFHVWEVPVWPTGPA